MIMCQCLIVSFKGELVKVENADSYIITNVSRSTTGEYKCSLIDNPTLEASKYITVNCKKPKHFYVELLKCENYCNSAAVLSV